jgi:4-hydroxybenzoate polyprenyltransferase
MSQFRAVAQLVRLPNLFTAFADIALGGFVAWGASGERSSQLWWSLFAMLLAASGCLYSAGMVWNDYFDVEQDRRERPFRPIPSGRVAPRSAAWLGVALLTAGNAFAILGGMSVGGWSARPILVAAGLTAAILVYDAWLKRTWAGPLGMGACRFLNVLLGMSIPATDPLRTIDAATQIHIAAIVGVYIIGVTWFARTEATESSRPQLLGATGVMLAGLALVQFLPERTSAAAETLVLFAACLVVFTAVVGVPVAIALLRPGPTNVQAAVKRMILGLVLLDATLATLFAGVYGLLILLLLPPAMVLGRWLYST